MTGKHFLLTYTADRLSHCHLTDQDIIGVYATEAGAINKARKKIKILWDRETRRLLNHPNNPDKDPNLLEHCRIRWWITIREYQRGSLYRSTRITSPDDKQLIWSRHR